LEDGGTVYNFFGEEKGSNLRSSIRVHNPAFYWKVSQYILPDLFNNPISWCSPKCSVILFELVLLYVHGSECD